MRWDVNVITKYNELEDNLQICIYYKNPPGRVLRKKWIAEWKVLPNLELFLSYFKGNENQLKNEFFYDMDYLISGNIQDKTKLMFPTDNTVLTAT